MFWVNSYLLFGGLVTKIPATDRGHALALWLAFWGIFTVILTIGSLSIDRAHPIFLGLLVMTFFALAVGQWSSIPKFIQLGGWTGLAGIAGALYVAAAQLFAVQFKRVVLHV